MAEREVGDHPDRRRSGPTTGRLADLSGLVSHFLSKPDQAGHLALLQALVIGMAAGLASVLFRWTMGAIGTWRDRVSLHPTAWWHWLILPGIGLFGGMVA